MAGFAMRAALPSPPLVPRPLTIIRAPCPAPRSVCSTTFDCFLTAPSIVKNVDKCMTDVSDATCVASYGATANLVTSGSKSMVGYIRVE